MYPCSLCVRFWEQQDLDLRYFMNVEENTFRIPPFYLKKTTIFFNTTYLWAIFKPACTYFLLHVSHSSRAKCGRVYTEPCHHVTMEYVSSCICSWMWWLLYILFGFVCMWSQLAQIVPILETYRFDSHICKLETPWSWSYEDKSTSCVLSLFKLNSRMIRCFFLQHSGAAEKQRQPTT